MPATLTRRSALDDIPLAERPIVVPWIALIDSGEQYPFRFVGLKADSDDDYRPLLVRTEQKHLGTSMGDYSIAVPLGDSSQVGSVPFTGMMSRDYYIGQVSVERKSLEDAHGTILGWGERRERFERELASLAAMRMAAVVVECSFGVLLANAPEWGVKTAAQNRKILHRQVLAWQQEYRVPWLFCDNRGLAEVTTFRLLERFYRKFVKGEK